MEEKQIQDELTSIRNLMERSSKFISLSGLSGILAGVYALIGAGLAYYVLDSYTAIHHSVPADTDLPTTGLFYGGEFIYPVVPLLIIALSVLVLSLATGITLSLRKAKRKSQPIWSNTSRSLLFHMAVPLVSGGLLALLFIHRGHYGTAAPICLIFYGLSLVAASNFTFTMVKYLGLSEIALGLIAACLPGYGLLFWAIGFGVLHIVYGSLMYLKYDR